MKRALLALTGSAGLGLAIGAFAGNVFVGFALGLAIGGGLAVMIGRGRPGRCATQRGEWEEEADKRKGAED